MDIYSGYLALRTQLNIYIKFLLCHIVVTHKQAEVVYFFNFLKISFNCSLTIRLQEKESFSDEKKSAGQYHK